MNHLKVLGRVELPVRGETLLEWEQKGVILGTFADALATLTEIVKSAEE